MRKITISVQDGLGEIAEALKVEGFNVVTLEKHKGYTDGLVYTGTSSGWTSLSHGQTNNLDINISNTMDNVVSIDATNKTSREVVDHLREIFGQNR